METLILLTTIINFIFLLILVVSLKPNLSRASKNSVLLDTSAIMDGRILEVVKSGFLPRRLLIPRFVIAEMQLLADKADHLKRERARFGLDIVKDLQDSRFADVEIISHDIKDEDGVDEKLVKLANKLNAMLFTTDFNLLKVAEIEGVRVLNINQLAQDLRMAYIPGEIIEVKIVSRGQEKTQGVGHLDDGTMVVVDKAGNQQGRVMKVEITRSLQTAAGRMMFAKALTTKASKRSTKRKQITNNKS